MTELIKLCFQRWKGLVHGSMQSCHSALMGLLTLHDVRDCVCVSVCIRAWWQSHLLGVEVLQNLEGDWVSAPRRGRDNVFDRETEVYDKYSVSTHHISFSLPRLTLLGFSPMCVQVRGGGERVRKKGKILSALMSSFLGNLKKNPENKKSPSRI